MTSGIYIRTDEAKRNMSIAQKNRAPRSEATRQKMSESRIGTHPSEVTRRKMSESRRGKPLSEEHKRNISESRMGEKNHNFGKDFSGENSPAWKGGISRNYKMGYYFKEYKNWRKSVFERDCFTCQECGDTGYITAHHIKSFAKYPELRYEIDNGMTLCEKCHSKTDNYKGKNSGKGDK